jgi:hypothetical protein
MTFKQKIRYVGGSHNFPFICYVIKIFHLLYYDIFRLLQNSYMMSHKTNYADIYVKLNRNA